MERGFGPGRTFTLHGSKLNISLVFQGAGSISGTNHLADVCNFSSTEYQTVVSDGIDEAVLLDNSSTITIPITRITLI
jgi:hypothetical protein